MTIMSFALDLDPAYVAPHQIVRYVAICLILPPLVSWWLERRKGNPMQQAGEPRRSD